MLGPSIRTVRALERLMSFARDMREKKGEVCSLSQLLTTKVSVCEEEEKGEERPSPTSSLVCLLPNTPHTNANSSSSPRFSSPATFRYLDGLEAFLEKKEQVNPPIIITSIVSFITIPVLSYWTSPFSLSRSYAKMGETCEWGKKEDEEEEEEGRKSSPSPLPSSVH